MEAAAASECPKRHGLEQRETAFACMPHLFQCVTTGSRVCSTVVARVSVPLRYRHRQVLKQGCTPLQS